jgi:protein SCO1
MNSKRVEASVSPAVEPRRLAWRKCAVLTPAFASTRRVTSHLPLPSTGRGNEGEGWSLSRPYQGRKLWAASPLTPALSPLRGEGAALWRNLALLALLILSVVVAAAGEKPACCSKKEHPAAAPLPDRSLYQIDSSWTNDAGVALKLTALRGKPQVVSMFFATCQFTCPVLINDMKRIEAALPENVRTNLGFLLVSFDTERDTPEALASYRAVHKLPPNWTLLRGGPDDVLEFANLLGIKFKKDLRGQFSHSNVIAVLDENGEVTEQLIGLNRDVTETVAAISRMQLRGTSGPQP